MCPGPMKRRPCRSGDAARNAWLGPRQEVRQPCNARWPSTAKQLAPARLRHRRHCQQRVEQRGKTHRHTQAVDQHDRGVQGLDCEDRRLPAWKVDQDQLPAMCLVRGHEHTVSCRRGEAGPPERKLMVPYGKGASLTARRPVAQRLAVTVMSSGLRHGRERCCHKARPTPASREPQGRWAPQRAVSPAADTVLRAWFANVACWGGTGFAWPSLGIPSWLRVMPGSTASHEHAETRQRTPAPRSSRSGIPWPRACRAWRRRRRLVGRRGRK